MPPLDFDCQILADSISPQGHRLTTIQATFPRFILAEANTHKMVAKNSASSRAVPIEKMLERVLSSPVVPVHMGANQRGMQAEAELEGEQRDEARAAWLDGCQRAADTAQRLLELGVHKQIANRVIEPWTFHTAILTATEWSNLFALRTHPDAQPEFQHVARMMLRDYQQSQPTMLQEGQWHLPLVDDEDRKAARVRFGDEAEQMLLRISAARCARVSYLTHDGRRDFDADLVLYHRLVEGGHMSPLEHVARPMAPSEWQIVEMMQADRARYCAQLGVELAPWMTDQLEFAAHLRGWVPARKLVPHEADFGSRPPVGE